MLRIPKEIETEAKCYAKKKHISYNSFVVQAIEAQNEREKLNSRNK